MLGAFAADHVNKIAYNLFCPKKRSIHPSSSLFHQCHHIRRGICESLRIGNVG